MKKVLRYFFATAMILAVALGMGACKPLSITPPATEKVTQPPETTILPETEPATEAVTEVPTEAPTEAPAEPPTEPETTAATEETVAPAAAGDPYYIKVNCQTNTVNIFTRDEAGEYTVPYRVMVCSSGLDETPTPTGTYHLTGNRWDWLELINGVWGQYTTQIIGDYLFHSVPYTEWGNHGSLQEGEFDKLGEDASHGCIRLQVDDAKWIYDHMWDIAAVEIYNDSDPGPLGKPTPMKIGEREFPGWDPTDLVEGNPWHQEHSK